MNKQEQIELCWEAQRADDDFWNNPYALLGRDGEFCSVKDHIFEQYLHDGRSEFYNFCDYMEETVEEPEPEEYYDEYCQRHYDYDEIVNSWAVGDTDMLCMLIEDEYAEILYLYESYKYEWLSQPLDVEFMYAKKREDRRIRTKRHRRKMLNRLELEDCSISESHLRRIRVGLSLLADGTYEIVDGKLAFKDYLITIIPNWMNGCRYSHRTTDIRHVNCRAETPVNRKWMSTRRKWPVRWQSQNNVAKRRLCQLDPAFVRQDIADQLDAHYEVLFDRIDELEQRELDNWQWEMYQDDLKYEQREYDQWREEQDDSYDDYELWIDMDDEDYPYGRAPGLHLGEEVLMKASDLREAVADLDRQIANIDRLMADKPYWSDALGLPFSFTDLRTDLKNARDLLSQVPSHINPHT